jgi:hypothetical protein
MGENSTPRVTFDATTLTAEQLDGLACVICNADHCRVDVPTVPVGAVDGCQVFACVPCVESPDDEFTAPVDAAHKVDVLAEIVNDLLATLVNDGRMSRTEERTWRGAMDAVVLDRPELLTLGGQVVIEAEDILRTA